LFYTSYMQNTKDSSLKELNFYIDKINNSKNIEEFFENSLDINYELSTDILVSPNILFNPKGRSEKYFGLDLITYDMDNKLGYYYSVIGNEDIVRMYKRYDIQILKEYGYTAEEAVKIADNVQKMYKDISKFSEPNPDNLYDNGYTIYKFDELQSKLKNIKIDKLTKKYSEFYNKPNEILVVDINQLKMIDEYLKEENLGILKEYATLKILSTYSPYISEDFSKIYEEYKYESNNYSLEKEYTKEEIGYKIIYNFFKDTITEEFSNKFFSEEQKDFYTNLIEEEINIFKERILNKEWLSETTKENAVKKLDSMIYTVGISEKLVKVENNYSINANNSYMSNVINIKKNIKQEEMRQYKKDNIFYNNSELDQLSFNACYIPLNNSINILLGYIYSLTETLELGTENLEENYYKILGSIGSTIGHELSHALDTTGSKYDEEGNYINWWTEDDEYNFNCLTSKVVKYYEKYGQYGDITIGENIADLGGVSIVLEIAQKRNATKNDFKDLFKTYALSFAMQCTPIMQEYLLKEDVHSPSKNRVNAVLATFNKFYEIYNIKQTDTMYIPDDNRVSVW